MECSTVKHNFKQLNRIISKKLKQISDRTLADKPPCALACLPVCEQKQKQNATEVSWCHFVICFRFSNFKVGKIDFKVCKINFKVGKINFNVRKINFKVGKINFKVGKINFNVGKSTLKFEKSTLKLDKSTLKLEKSTLMLENQL